MAKKTQIDRAVEALEGRINTIQANAQRDVDAIQLSIDTLRAQPKRTRKAKKPAPAAGV